MVKSIQWRIQDFPGVGAPTPKVGVLTYYSSENCMKMKAPLDPPLQYMKGDGCISWVTYSIVSFSCTQSSTFVIDIFYGHRFKKDIQGKGAYENSSILHMTISRHNFQE